MIRAASHRLFIVFAICLMALCGASQSIIATIDSAKKHHREAASDPAFVRNCFFIADNFMELDQYDSAQLWLNKIAAVLPLKKPSLSTYFLSTRQAEVYYYTGLQRIGLQEAERSLSIATALHDSLLLSDSYNFLGLFYTNLQQYSTAVSYLYKGIGYSRQPPYPAAYVSLSLPHHLYGNIAEAYEKAGQLDSAILYSRLSYTKAAAIHQLRGMAVACNNLGTIFLKGARADSSAHYFLQSTQLAVAGKDFDVELLNLGGAALASRLAGSKVASLTWLNKGFELIAAQPTVNDFFKGRFLDMAMLLYRAYNMPELLLKATTQKNGLLTSQVAGNNRQINVILNAGLQNETRLLNLEIKEATQQRELANSRFYLLVLVVVALVAAFFFYRYKTHQQLRVVLLQNQISQDLHDDVGSSLSSLQVYSSVALRLVDAQPDKAKEMLHKITVESAAVMENIGDIVWSIKTDKQQTMEERIKNYVADVLGAANISYTIRVEAGVENNITNLKAKRNILLIIKEAVSNSVKYSKARQVSVAIKTVAAQLCIQVTDDGIGFHPQRLLKKGDGLANMQKRTTDSGGLFSLTAAPGEGTVISVLFPLTKIRDDR